MFSLSAGWYCDSDNDPPPATCSAVMQGLCGAAKTKGETDCLICCGSHQQSLQSAGCDSADFTQFCG